MKPFNVCASYKINVKQPEVNVKHRHKHKSPSHDRICWSQNAANLV